MKHPKDGMRFLLYLKAIVDSEFFLGKDKSLASALRECDNLS